MNKTELAAAFKQELANSLGGDNDGELSNNRAQAWTYFLGDPIGGEKEGHSQVVSTDLAEVIDWVMPEVVRAFGENTIEFAAYSEEDENQAENEAKAVQHVFFRENQGLLILHNWFQETLLQKNGYVKPYWDDEPEYETEQREGLSDIELQALVMSGYEVVDDEVIEEIIETLEGPITNVYHNVEIRRVVSEGRVVVDNIPSNECLVNSGHTQVSLKTARLAAHQRLATQSELIEMGFDRKVIDDLPSHSDIEDSEEIARDHISDEDDDEPADRSQRQILFTEGYWLVDADDDGISERYKVHYAGNDILSMEPTNTVDLVSLTALPLSSKHLGRSMFDKIRQIVDIKTAIWRQVIDNLFLQNNSRHAIVEGKVNIRDLLNSRAGGIVRMKESGAIEPLKAPSIGSDAYQFLEYLDRVRTERTGVGPEIVAELGQLANSTAWGVERLMAKKEELIGMVIAIFRATGINELFEHIHRLLRENGSPMTLPVDGQWLQQDPQQWRPRTTIPPVTWSGLGDRLEKQKALQGLMGIQEKLAMSPYGWMVSPKHIYETVSDYVRASGVSNVQQYLLDPQSPAGQQAMQRAAMAAQQQKQDPAAQALAQVEQIKGQYSAQIAQIKEFSRQQVEKLKAQMTAMQESADMKQHMDDLQFKYDQLDQQFIEKLTAVEADLIKASTPQQIPEGML